MKFLVKPAKLSGEVAIPGSKSHTIRALVMALLAQGESIIEHPLDSSDTRSCCRMIEQFGATVTEKEKSWHILGTGGELPVPDDIVDIGNSGTTLYIGISIASLIDGFTILTGDHQIRNRPADSLLTAINDLGGKAFSTRSNGQPPLVIGGKIRGGETSIEAVTSQYLTSLLIAAPLAAGNTTISIPLLNEAPYVHMTLSWLDKLGIQYQNNNMKSFNIAGNQKYRSFREPIPADFSSATFFLAAAAVTGAELTLQGLDFTDTQGDKEAALILQQMGAELEISERKIRVKGNSLKGGVFDLNSIPDALPALAVTACFADGETRLINVPQARLKETDRIKVMHDELGKMGADIRELPDGLVIKGGSLKGCPVKGHGDHRVVMALAVAGLMADGETIIDTAESVSITFPDYRKLMNSLGAQITEIQE